MPVSRRLQTCLVACLVVSLAAIATLSASAQKAPAAASELNESERALVAGSRAAIIKTGISPAFFDEHFRVERVVDRPGDRRVVWRLSVGGHETTVNDSIGFYTEGARRVDTHSVASTLPSTSDIKRTLTRRRAETLMRRCLGGAFSDPQVEYRAQGEGGRAALLLTASRIIPPRPESRAARARREREERAARAQEGAARQGQDPLRSKSRAPQPVVMLGAVDLVTGECSVGYGQVGPPKPKPAGASRLQR